MDPDGKAAHVVDLANALASLVPMLPVVTATGTTMTAAAATTLVGGIFGGGGSVLGGGGGGRGVGLESGDDNREGASRHDDDDDDPRGVVAEAFIRAIPPVAALLARGTAVGRRRAMSALRRLASVSGHSLLKVMAAHDVISAAAAFLETTAPAVADAAAGRADGLASAIEIKRTATASRGGDDVRDGNHVAAAASASRDDAVQLLAALVAAAGDDVSSAGWSSIKSSVGRSSVGVFA